MKVFEATCLDPSSQASTGLKIQAMESLRSSLSFVGDMVVRAARVHLTSAAVIDMEVVDYLIHSIVEVIEKEVANTDREMADRVIDQLHSIKLPKRKTDNGSGADEVKEFAMLLRKATQSMGDTVPVMKLPPRDVSVEEGGEPGTNGLNGHHAK